VNILYVDDDKEATDIYSRKLEKEGYSVDVLHSGIDCIQYFKSLKNLNNIDLVLLDVVIPDMSGVEILEQLRKDYSESELPIVMLTGLTKEDDIIDALKKGANDFLQKPINFSLVKARLDMHLRLKEKRLYQLAEKEYETFHSLVVTYNHEINNPLTVALGELSKIKKSEGYSCQLENIENSLERIKDIVEKLSQASEDRELHLTKSRYCGKTNMYTFEK